MKLKSTLLILGSFAVMGGVAFSADRLANRAYRLNDVAWDCPNYAKPSAGAADNTGVCSGAWSSRSTSTSTSEAITVTGAAIGDSCAYVPGVTVAATAQALDWTCAITAANTATLRVTNASGGSLTPTTGRRGVHVRGLEGN